MSTLAIEGGHRLSGSVDVEGNKNSALPLLAACLLTTEECVLTNVPRISDVEVMARLLIDLGATVEGIGTTTLRVRCLEVVKDEPDGAMVGRLRGSVLLFGPLLARRGRARLAPPGGDFPARRSISTHLEALAAMGARAMPHQGHGARGSGRAQAGIDLPLRGVRDRNRDGAARRGGGPGRVGDPPRRVRAARGRAVRVPAAAWRRRDRRRDVHDPDRRRRRSFMAPSTGCAAITSRRAVGPSWPRSPAARLMSGARARKIWKWSPRCCGACRSSARSTASFSGFAIDAAGGGQNHDRTLARVSERSRQSGHGAGHAGHRTDARPRLAVRVAALRARAVERHGRGSVSLRPAPDHRHRRPEAFEGAPARQPRSAIGDGADCRRRWRGTA